MTTIRIEDKKLMALTAEELRVLESIVKIGDRAGYDMAYYLMSGVSVVALEARVATFSGPSGGVAFAANRLLQQWYGPGTEASPQYPGIYFLSHLVAQEGFDAVRQSALVGGGGYVGHPIRSRPGNPPTNRQEMDGYRIMEKKLFQQVTWSGQQDSNLRLPAPKAGALPG